MAINFVIIIFLVVLFLSFIRNVGRIIPRRNLPWILGGYLIILLAAVLFLPMLPKENFPTAVSEEVRTQAQRGHVDLQQAALAGRPEQIDGAAKLKQWDFAFSGNQLQVTGADNSSGVMIIADQKDTNDGKIEVISYATKTILEGIDVTKDIKLPKVSLEGNILEITMPEQYRVEIAKFSKDFVMTQLTRAGKEQGTQNIIGAQVLYLRIPQKVQIGANKLGILFADSKLK